MAGFFTEQDGTYRTSIRNIQTARQWFKEHPGGKISTGMWTDGAWTEAQFTRWLRDCLNAKINSHLPASMTTGRKHSREWQLNAWRDAREVNDYYGRRLRHSGCRGLLRTPEMQRRYPEVNTQERDW